VGIALLALTLLAITITLIFGQRDRVESNDSLTLPTEPQTTASAEAAAGRATSVQGTRQDGNQDADSSPRNRSDEAVFRSATDCRAKYPDIPSDLNELWICLRALDWEGVTAPALAAWLCDSDLDPREMNRVAAAALHARTPDEALTFLNDFAPECIEVRETSLQIMAVETIAGIDPEWVERLGDAIVPERVFTGESSTQALLLAEYFIRRGDSRIETLLKKGGRGEFGGSTKEITRAARVSLFVTSTIQGDSGSAANAWVYAESLIHSPTVPPETGGVLAAFLPSRQTWPEGDSGPALGTLALALDDPELQPSLAVVLWATQTSEGPEGCDAALWGAIWDQVEAIAASRGWPPLPK
jgi:hypothetical protein